MTTCVLNAAGVPTILDDCCRGDPTTRSYMYENSNATTTFNIDEVNAFCTTKYFIDVKTHGDKWIAFYYYVVLGGIFGIIFNLFVGWTIVRNKKLRRNQCYILIFCQLIIDFIYLFQHVVYDLHPVLDTEKRMPAFVREEMVEGSFELTEACTMESIFIMLIICSTLYTTGLIGYDRYRAICTPMNKLKRNDAVKIWFGTVIYGSFLSVINLQVGSNISAGFNLYCGPNFSDKRTLLLVVVMGFVPALGTNIYFYGRVAYELYKMFKVKTESSKELTATEKKGLKQLMIGKKLLFLAAWTAICWTPALLTMLIESFELVDKKYWVYLDVVTSCGAITNSASNSFLVVFFLNAIRNQTNKRAKKYFEKLTSGIGYRSTLKGRTSGGSGKSTGMSSVKGSSVMPLSAASESAMSTAKEISSVASMGRGSSAFSGASSGSGSGSGSGSSDSSDEEE